MTLEKTLELIKRFEGCRLKAYRCPAGIWTIGWGETKGVKEGDVWTQEHADQMLLLRTIEFMLGTATNCNTLSGARLAASTSLAYNIGIGAFSRSTVCRRAKRKEWRGAADAMLMWNKAGGRVLKGLTLRRQVERLLFLSEK